MNQRNNARILYRIAKELDLNILVGTDPCACSLEDSETAMPTTETLLYDIVKQGPNHASYFSNCVDTLSVRNGILCAMHPSEVCLLPKQWVGLIWTGTKPCFDFNRAYGCSRGPLQDTQPKHISGARLGDRAS